MADRSNAALAISTASAIAAALALVRKPVSAANGGGDLNLPPEVIELLAAIAQDVENISQQDPVVNVGTVQGYPKNTESMAISRLSVQALNAGQRFPDQPIPDGFNIVIKAWPTNAGIIYIARSETDAKNVVQVWPLLPNEFVGWQIKNANIVYFGGTNVGDSLVFTCEERRG